MSFMNIEWRAPARDSPTLVDDARRWLRARRRRATCTSLTQACTRSHKSQVSPPPFSSTQPAASTLFLRGAIAQNACSCTIWCSKVHVWRHHRKRSQKVWSTKQEKIASAAVFRVSLANAVRRPIRPCAAKRPHKAMSKDKSREFSPIACRLAKDKQDVLLCTAAAHIRNVVLIRAETRPATTPVESLKAKSQTNCERLLSRWPIS
mmetsp:Transcript_158925/g.509805  ORF Transcript_158925/g.509805 Transcript_158925/m.509805 type:complete len:206 (-) Transcript_158925:2775-3392(-)